MAYECKDNGWEVGFEVCVCPKQDYVKNEMLKIKEEKAPTTDLCCPVSYITEKNGQLLTCPYGNYTETRTCDSEVWTSIQDPTEIWTSKTDKKDNNVCIGYTMHEQAGPVEIEFEKGILATQYKCKKLCGGKTPCIRYFFPFFLNCSTNMKFIAWQWGSLQGTHILNFGQMGLQRKTKTNFHKYKYILHK